MKSQTKSKDFINKTIFRIGFLSLLLFLFSCKSDNSEQKEYDSLKSNLKYKSYKTLSDNTIPPLVLLYNSTSHNEDPVISEGVLRLLLGYSWIVNNKSNYAIAEGNIIQDLSTNDKDLKFLAHSLVAISMYEEGWKKLAVDEAEKGESLLNKEPKTTESQLKIMTFHIIMGTLSVYLENFQGARFHFAGLSIATGISWPYQIADAMADLKEGKNKQGLLKIKVLKSEKDIPETVKKTLSETLDKIEKTSGTVDSKLFWPRSISLALYGEIKNSEINGIDKVTELLDNLSEKLKID
jgi:hypothetical protein